MLSRWFDRALVCLVGGAVLAIALHSPENARVGRSVRALGAEGPENRQNAGQAAAGLAVFGQPNAEGWIDLFDGKSLLGWRDDAGPWQAVKGLALAAKDDRRFDIQSGEGVLVNGPDGKAHNLFTNAEFGDVDLHVEFVVPRGSNSGVYLQGRYEIQILDSFGVDKPQYSDCGGIYQRWKDNQGYEGRAPRENASRAPGEWQEFDIAFRAPRFDVQGQKSENARLVKVVHNGVTIHENVELTGPTRAAAHEDEQPLGPLMFQGDHGPVGLRNLRIRPLDVAPPANAAARWKRLPGVQDAGDVLLPNQWSLRPAGKQIKLGDFPVNIALHPTEPYAAILHAGHGDHEIVVIDLVQDRVVSRASLRQAFYGLCFDPAGKRLYASGAEFEVVHRFAFDGGYLGEHREFAVGKIEDTFVPAGVACSPDGNTLYAACAWGDTLCVLPVERPDTLKHVKLAPQSYPYAALPDLDGGLVYVALWGRAAIAVYDVKAGKFTAEWPTLAHPTEMALSPDGARLFVVCANTNETAVHEVGVGRRIETLAGSLYPAAPAGSTPNSLSLTPDGKVLFVANADNNNVAVWDVSNPKRGLPLGHIPAGWYPTSVRYDARSHRVYIANGKGISSQANPQGPQPLKKGPRTVEQYIGGLFRGTLSVVNSPSPAEMADYTRRSRECSPLSSDARPVSAPAEEGHPIPRELGQASPIKHCIYIVKENRTYDQVFGDMPEGNGDPALCIFPERVTPNHHALARQFVLLDNFYVESEVSADGHEWSMAAYATDFVEKTWPLLYRGGGKDKIKYPSEGEAAGTVAAPGGGYIWDRCREAGVGYYSYGEFVVNGATPNDPATSRLKSLEGHFDPRFRSYDLDYPDALRTDRFLEELARYEKEGDMPQFIVLRLPNDHTHGQSAGKPTPTAMVAENDLALGRLIEGLSRSKFWRDTAVFVVEDDAQNGSDHVDAHRTVALVVSPYCKRGFVDSNMYSTSSMLRTMELILGLQPMSQFDAAALPMYNSFSPTPDLSPFEHRAAQVDLAAVNSPDAWGAAISAALDFSREDACDDLLLNDIIWRSVRGPDSPMPSPVRAAFVYASAEDDEEEEEEEEKAAEAPRE